MEINKKSIIEMIPDFLATLNDASFKSSLLQAKNNPEVLTNPMAMMGLIMPKLTIILKKHGFTEPNAPQQFVMFLLMNQNDPEIKDLAEKLQKSLIE